jgi:hypothetical protein
MDHKFIAVSDLGPKGLGMPGPRRTPAQRLKERTLCAQWYCQGVPQHQMASRLGMSVKQVEYDLRLLRVQWRRERQSFADRLDVELAKLDNLEREAWEAWHHSRQPTTTTEVRAQSRGPNGGGADVELHRTTRTEQGYGDPRYLELVLRCIDRRCRLLGLDAPARGQPEVALWHVAEVMAAETGVDVSALMAEAERMVRPLEPG